MSQPVLSPDYAIVRSTVRVLAGSTGQPPTTVGTGFFYKTLHPTAGIAKVLVVTNKHVVRGAEEVQFVLSSAPSLTDLDDHRQPIGKTDHLVTWPLNGNLYPHPDCDTDLCGIDVTIPVGQVIRTGRQLRVMTLDASWLPKPAERNIMRDVEQVLVVGYPRGIWDEYNNMPIARLGTTATHPLACYQGKRDFLVDVAAFQGSSGSPVFAFETPMFRQHGGSYSPGTKARFIGVIWGVVECTVEGELKLIEIPSAATQVPVINTSMSLAIALHGEAIRDLDELVFPGINSR
jgi:hypothetical protein